VFLQAFGYVEAPRVDQDATDQLDRRLRHEAAETTTWAHCDRGARSNAAS